MPAQVDGGKKEDKQEKPMTLYTALRDQAGQAAAHPHYYHSCCYDAVTITGLNGLCNKVPCVLVMFS